MANKGFGNSIGGGRGSASIDTNSVKQSSASGSPVGGYKPGGWGSGGCPEPEKGAGLANTQMSSRKPAPK
jgi:hypothetical protein